jgi:hypothetical protein
MLEKLTINGRNSERELYVHPDKMALIERALEVGGYRVTRGGTVNPWQEQGTTRNEMIATSGRISKDASDGLLYLTDNEEDAKAAWAAISLCHPQASCSPQGLERPA